MDRLVLIYGGAAMVLGFGTVRQTAALWRATASRRWPTTRGRVLQSGVSLHFSTLAKVPSTYVPQLVYEYRVDGHTYRGTRYNLLGAGLVNIEKAWSRHRRLQDSSEVTVWYDPADPTCAVLAPGATCLDYIVAGFTGLVCALVLLQLILLASAG
jgi:hypothetical protein